MSGMTAMAVLVTRRANNLIALLLSISVSLTLGILVAVLISDYFAKATGVKSVAEIHFSYFLLFLIVFYSWVAIKHSTTFKTSAANKSIKRTCTNTDAEGST